MSDISTSSSIFILSFLVSFLAILLIMDRYKGMIGAFMTKPRKLVRAVAVIVGVAIYLNIGWAYGTYSAMHLGDGMSQTTILQQFLAGPDKVFVAGPNPNLPAFQIVFMLFWLPSLVVTIVVWVIWLFVAVAAWMLWFVLLLFSGLWQVIMFALRLVFAGGIAKLLGVG